MSSGDEQEPSEPPGSSTRAPGRAAYDSTAPRITLPDEGDGARSTPAPATAPPLDAWNEDRVRRSSFPPAGAAAPWASRRVAPVGPVRRDVDDGSEGDALHLVHRSSTTNPAVDLSTEMEERYSLDDFTGALRVAEFLLGREPGDPRAQHYAALSRQKLEQMLYTQLTQHGTVPLVAVREEEIRWLGLDSRAAWLLSRVDGASDCDALLEAVGLARLDGLRLLTQLREAGAIRMR